MFGRRIPLFSLFGFRVALDPSWFILAILITWSLATGYFPFEHEGMARQTYWWMGAAGAIGLFVSIVLHEMAHAWVARRHGLPMKGITLFIFGGVAEMSREPDSPTVEFRVAIAGPIASTIIAILFYWAALVGQRAGWPVSMTGVLEYLALINLVLVAFNAIPAFPLDGGRVLRSFLWRWKDSLRWATRVTSRIGSGFGLLLIALGIFSVLSGHFVAGMWWFLIGLFLRGAAQASYQQLLLRQVLEGEEVRRFMNDQPISVERSISIAELVEDYIYRYHHKLFPVVDHGRLVGCVSSRQVREVPREEWDRQSVGSIASPCDDDNTVAPDDDALVALRKMSRGTSSRLMVVEGEHLLGILALKDLLQFFSLKIELENQSA